jgi:colanic acid/amylovoran biosynthesis glycosyltransferase
VAGADLSVLHSSVVWLPQTETWLHRIVKDLERMKVATHVVCERTENLDQFHVDNIHSLEQMGSLLGTWDRAMRKLRLRRHLAFLEHVARKVRPQIVHSHFGNVAWANRCAVRALRAKHVVTFYGQDVNRLPTTFPFWRARYRALFADADRVLCEGTHMARCIVALGCPEKKVRVHHLGIAVDEIPFVPRRWLRGEDIRVLIAASFVEKKGIPYAIEALGRLAREVPVALTVIGDARAEPESQAEKRRILAALDRAGLLSRTRLLGYQPHAVLLREAYAHHIYVQPSVTAADGDTEGGAPISLIEMLATGMPVVSTRHCDIPDVLGPALAGWLAPERDTNALEAIMRRLLAQAQDWEALVAQGRDHIARDYHCGRQAFQLLDHYREVLAAT